MKFPTAGVLRHSPGREQSQGNRLKTLRTGSEISKQEEERKEKRLCILTDETNEAARTPHAAGTSSLRRRKACDQDRACLRFPRSKMQDARQRVRGNIISKPTLQEGWW
jgi:hypothetical protein